MCREPPALHPSIERVRQAASALGLSIDVRSFAESTRTAQDAAAAIGTSLGQIVKSLVFLADGQPILVLASGPNRADTAKLARAAGAQKVQRASASEVQEATGFTIGGVPPIGHDHPLPLFFDRDLLQYDTLWAAAGTPNAVFAVEPQRLIEASGAVVLDLKED
jgi:prolyl-tRNA editing enzyme YbaK/EbsC (Cys-tRNA(Pro) deacylase)